ncbi:MAG: SRPBCC domain-containing protein [Crocinitomicaceae bacterium]
MEFTLKTTIKASAKDIYVAWMSSDGHTKMTGGEAEISDEIEADFTAWDGYIEGKNIALEPYKRIVQSWRTHDFEDSDENSQIEILLNEMDNGTELTLIHTGLSESGGHYKKGWDDSYFKPMKDYFHNR